MAREEKVAGSIQEQRHRTSDSGAYHPREDRAVIESDVRAFLEPFTASTTKLLEIRTIVPDGEAQSTFCSSVEAALQVVIKASGSANVYAGACPRVEKRGSRESINSVVAAWADLDYKDFDATDRSRAQVLVQERLASFPIRPTMLVFTGNGVQARWQFNQPLPISTEISAERFEAINRGIAQVLGGDHVWDLARVLRVPGTLNLPDAKKRAHGCVQVMARLIYADGPTYDVAAFRPWEVYEQAAKHATNPQPIAPPAQPNSEVLEAFNELLKRLGPDHLLSRTWRGERALRDTSRSGWDMALANQLFRSGVREEFIPQILQCYPLGKASASPRGYLVLTLSKARRAREYRHES